MKSKFFNIQGIYHDSLKKNDKWNLVLFSLGDSLL